MAIKPFNRLREHGPRAPSCGDVFPRCDDVLPLPPPRPPCAQHGYYITSISYHTRAKRAETVNAPVLLFSLKRRRADLHVLVIAHHVPRHVLVAVHPEHAPDLTTDVQSARLVVIIIIVPSRPPLLRRGAFIEQIVVLALVVKRVRAIRSRARTGAFGREGATGPSGGAAPWRSGGGCSFGWKRSSTFGFGRWEEL
jgi:hypothetical protein